MRRLLAVLCVLMLPLAAFGQSVTLPAEIKGAVGAWIIVAPTKIDGGTPRWRIDDGLQEVRLDLLLPPEMLKQLKGKVVTSNVPGKYRIECWNAKGDAASEIATCWVTIGTPGPTPPTPDPPPAPVDAFTQSLQHAYAVDGKSAEKLLLLLAIYRNSATVVNDPANKTPADVFTVMKKSIATVLKEPDANAITILPYTRRAIGAELDKALPLGAASTKPMDATTRTLISGQFARVQKALEGVSP